MANLKDTIVLGNLTVTGSVNASSILSTGGNAFNSIIVPNQSQLTIDYNNSAEDKFLMYLDGGTVTLQATDGGGNSGTLQFVNSGVYASYFFADGIHKFGHVGDLQIGSSTENLILGAGNIKVGSSLLPNGTSINLGGSSNAWSNLYLSSSIIKGSYTLTLPSKTGTIALTSDIKNPTDYYWANVQVSATSNSATTPTFSGITCSSTNPISMTGAGSGTYNRAVIYCDSDGVTLETNRATDASDGTAKPFMVKTRGGQYADIKSYNSHVTNLYSTVNTDLWLTGTAEGWKLPGNDTYGCIYPAATNYGQIGISSNKFWKGYINNLYSSNTYTSTCTYTNKITANTNTTGTGQYTGKISLTPSTYGWKLSAESNVAAPYSHAFYPETNNKGAVGIDYYHFSQGWINYLYTYIIYPTDSSSTTYKANVGKVGTSTYYFSEGSFYKVYRSTESSLSDIRLKQNVSNNKLSALNIVNQLDIIDFQYLEDFKQDEILKKKKLKAAAAMKSLEKTKDNRQLRKRLQEIISTPNNSKMRTIGISAQQLESLLPPEYLKTFISKEATEKYSDQYFIKENRLIYLVMKAVQEQQAIIDEQQNKITSLEERMAHLESLLLGDK